MIDPRKLKPGERFFVRRAGDYTVTKVEGKFVHVIRHGHADIEIVFGMGREPLKTWPWPVASRVESDALCVD